MDTRKEALDDFFNQYAARFNSALGGGDLDVDAATLVFAECFIEASPTGILCGKNDKKFKKLIPKGYERYRKIGITSMHIMSKEIALLDEFHAMVTIHWKSSFTRKDKSTGSISFDVIYLLQTLNNEYKIFAYITGDEQKALRQWGLI